MRGVEPREVQVIDVATPSPSPFARTLLFGYVAQFVYEGDSPIAERRAAALSLDQGLLAELLGRAELRELLDPEVLAEVEAELQRLTPDRRPAAPRASPTCCGCSARSPRPRCRSAAAEGVDAAGALAELAATRRVVEVRVAGRSAGPPIEDIGRLRDGLGVAVPPGTPDAFTDPVEDPLADLVSRFARTHGPVHHRRGRRPPRASARPWSATPCSASAARAGCSTASSDPAAPASSGATPRCCARCGVARWPGCARRSSRSSRPRSAASWPPGST